MLSKVYILLSLLLAGIIWGCGYISRSGELKHIDSVSIPPIGNETVEYELENNLAEALKQEFRPWGEGTDSVFTGSIKKYEVIPISWDPSNRPEQYRIFMGMSFVFEDLKRNKVLRNENNYEKTYDFYVVSDRGKPPETLKEAKEKFIREVAEDIVSSIVEEW
ncbi:hypothetical protein FJZ33_09930 [Candidatus Poribacteria bacterium]|nr:hypothetical protein [Candidatus Poribacteria bacterium]